MTHTKKEKTAKAAGRVAAEHSPLPWKLNIGRWAEGAPISGWYITVEGKKALVANSNMSNHVTPIVSDEAISKAPDFYKDLIGESEAEANARLIVTAVNSHDELVEALESLLNCTELNLQEMEHGTFKAIETARAALSKAKQGE